MAAPIVMSDEELFQLTGSWEAAAALRDQQYRALNEYNFSQTAPTSGGMLSGNILAGASWNSLNTTLADQLTEATGQATSNYAVGGATTADTLAQLNNYLDGGGRFDPTATVFLQTGGVDFLQGVDKATIKNNINQICKTLGSQGVNVVLTGSPYASSINDVVTNNFDPKVDPLFNQVAKENKNVALVGTQGEILQNKKLLIDALHTNAEGTSIYNQSVIDSLSKFKNEVPSSTPSAIQQAQKSNVVATAPAKISQLAETGQNMATNSSVESLIALGTLNPAQIASMTGLTEGEIASRAAATVPQGQTITLGDTIVQPNYQVIGSGEDQQIGNLENVYTYKVGENQVGGGYNQYTSTGELERTGTQQEVNANKDFLKFALGGAALFGGLGGGFESLFGGGGAATGAAGTVGTTGLTMAELAQLDLALGGGAVLRVLHLLLVP
jgi:hypothetical protein